MGKNIRSKMLRSVAAFVCVITIYGVAADDEDNTEGERRPRLFYVTTQSTTSTLTTASFCWATSAATTGTCARRKRSGNFFPTLSTSEEIAPSRSGSDDIAGSLRAELETPEGVREGKFVLYWLTTTSTSTTTAYSTTASLTCTPSGFGLSSCG